MIYDKTRALEPGYYDQFEMVYKPALEKDRKDAERYRWLRDRAHMVPADSWSNALEIRLPLLGGKARLGAAGDQLDAAIDEAMRTTEQLLVAPPVTKGKAICEGEDSHAMSTAELLPHTETPRFYELNQCVDDYDLTSNDTRRGD